MAEDIPSAPVSLLEIMDRILDNNTINNAFAQMPLVGIELFTIRPKGILSSIESYLKCAERIHKLGLVATLTSSVKNATTSLHEEPQVPMLPMPLNPSAPNILTLKTFEPLTP